MVHFYRRRRDVDSESLSTADKENDPENPAKRRRPCNTAATAVRSALTSAQSATQKQLEEARTRDQQRHQELLNLHRESIVATQGVGKSLERLADNFEKLAQLLQSQPRSQDNTLNQAIAASLLRNLEK